MENKFRQINIFESSLDAFEFDEGFLMKVDSELKKNKINEKQSNSWNKCNPKQEDKQKEKENKISDLKADSYDLPLFIEDLNESDFFDSSKKNYRKHSSKVVLGGKDEKEKKATSNKFASCLSPILGPKASTKLNLSSSTPLKPHDDSHIEEKPSTAQELEKNSAKNSQFDYFDADLFDEWDINDVNKKNIPKDTVTLSQALKLIEEAESAKQEEEFLNQSFDLLTGEVVGGTMGKYFEESFDLPKSTDKKSDKVFLNDSVAIIDEVKVGSKPAAAQKLNFGPGKVNCFNLTNDKKYNFSEVFNSDDDFNFVTQELLKKPKGVSIYGKPALSNFTSKNITPLKDSDLNESSDDIIIRKKKKGKCFNIIESDGTEDSPSPKFSRKNKSVKRKNIQENFGREFIESEAEVSDEFEVSSDEAEEEGEYDKSFLDEESYFSQNNSANMTAKYLESVKTVKRFGSFKIPMAKPYNPDIIFSQVPEESSTDYEIDSFCVPNDVEEEIKTDLSDLEVAEKILEMDRKKRKKKRTQKFRKLNYNK